MGTGWLLTMVILILLFVLVIAVVLLANSIGSQQRRQGREGAHTRRQLDKLKQDWQVAEGLGTIARMQQEKLDRAATPEAPAPKFGPVICYRCTRPATVSRTDGDLCHFCSTVVPPPPPLIESVLETPPVKAIRRKKITRAMRRRRLAIVLIPTTLLFILIVIVVVLTIKHGGWDFFVLRKAGVGGSPD